ncbi:chymotrypsin-like elastase family member 1 [Schistocerca nitens]|uniref:chymotrypsin-like elastase family member 1 n=1 Tax=Schistocerca nitens TaxID=7011 RepID=UPI00211765D8|nr:chymotrypsin-like elastase family member 1 [Schistocerca nitens]
MQQLLWMLVVSTAVAQGKTPKSETYQPNQHPWTKLQSPGEGRLIGGGQAVRGQFPHAAYLNIDDGAATCGATLLTETWLLTSAQCLSGFSKWWVYLGVEDLSTSDDYASIFDCYTILVHPGYNSTTKVHDIGLIYSASLIPFNQYIKPAVLPRYSDVDSSLEGSENTVCGWGSQTTGGAGSQTLWYAYFDSVTLCSPAWSYCGVGRYGEALCSGDFGTPMQRKEADGNFTVVGVASFIQGTTTCEGATSGFVMVAAYLDWLGRHTRLPVYP